VRRLVSLPSGFHRFPESSQLESPRIKSPSEATFREGQQLTTSHKARERLHLRTAEDSPGPRQCFCYLTAHWPVRR
jgi:hypothetical protein